MIAIMGRHESLCGGGHDRLCTQTPVLVHAHCHFFFLKTPVKKPGDGRKVTFFEPSHGDENGTSKCNPLGPMCSGFA